MSVPVEVEKLQDEVAERGTGAFLLTVGADLRPRIVAVTLDPAVGAEGALTMGVGRSSARNARERPGVSLFWPPAEPGGYSLIVDGEADLPAEADPGAERLTVRATQAILHRPRQDESSPGCSTSPSSDCQPL